jgi:phospholipid transport system substrate-binding protein
MNTIIRQISKVVVVLVASLSMHAYAAEEGADALVKRISQEIIAIAKTDKSIQAGDRNKIEEVVEAKILPHVDFSRMTSLAVGRNWRDANADQQKQLITEFRTLLIHTYSGAISQIKDQNVEFKPFRAAPEDTEVEVKSMVTQSRGEPLQLSYRLAKLPTGWKIYDINILGAWLVETYKGSFAAEVKKTGIDGLLKVLIDKNKKLNSKK